MLLRKVPILALLAAMALATETGGAATATSSSSTSSTSSLPAGVVAGAGQPGPEPETEKQPALSEEERAARADADEGLVHGRERFPEKEDIPEEEGDAFLSVSEKESATVTATEGTEAFFKLGRALGISTGGVPDGNLRASSAHGNNWFYYGPRNSRLNWNRNYRSWLAQYNRDGEWIEVDLSRPQEIGGIATRGSVHGHWIREYYLLYSNDATQWKSYSDTGTGRKIFQGNYDGNSIVRHTLTRPILARYVRLVGVSRHGWPVMRWELYATQNEEYEGGQPLGLQSGTVTNDRFRASTAHGNNWHYYGPQHARLMGGGPYGGWIPRYNRAGEWVQVDLGKVKEVGQVATQGRRDGSYWVRSYYITYSRDGNTWQSYMEGGQRRLFDGNVDYWNVVKHEMHNPFLARYVRLIVNGFNSWPVLRWELYAPEPPRFRLGKPLGLSSGVIPDSAITASSAHGNNWNYYGPRNARLYGGHAYGAWIPRYNRNGEWVQVDLGRAKTIGGVATQGRKWGSYWVQSYHLLYSLNGSTWSYYMANGQRQNFKGNNDPNSVVSHVFPAPFVARYVRLVVTSRHSWVCMRFELYAPHASRMNKGKLETIGKAMGLADGSIKDNKIRASSVWQTKDGACLPKNARLNSKSGAGAWCAAANNAKQWIQVETDGTWKVGGLATQGRNVNSDKYRGYHQWVTSYTVTYSDDGKKWSKVLTKDKKSAQIFRGNLDSNKVVRQAFLRPFKAKYVRIHPMGWYAHISMRFEIYDTAARQARIKAQREAAAKAAAERAAAEKAALLAKLAKEKAEREAKRRAEKAKREAAAKAKALADHKARMAKTAEEKKAALAAQAAAKKELARVAAENKALDAQIAREKAKDAAAREKLRAKLAKANALFEEEKFDEDQYKTVMRQIARIEEKIAKERTAQLHAKVAWEAKVAANDVNKKKAAQLKKRIAQINRKIKDVKAKYDEDIAARKAAVRKNTSGSTGDAVVDVRRRKAADAKAKADAKGKKGN